MLDDKDIEKRMIETLEEHGRSSMDDLAKLSGINRGRVEKALQELEKEELVHHITLEGVPRFYVAAIALVKDKSSDKIALECPWCREEGFKSNGSLGQHKRRCPKKPNPGGTIKYFKEVPSDSGPRFVKEIKPPLVLDSPQVTTTGDVTTAWNISQSIPIIPGEKVMENKEVVETKEENGKVGQYARVVCPKCGTKWSLALSGRWSNPTARLVECPFCRT